MTKAYFSKSLINVLALICFCLLILNSQVYAREHLKVIPDNCAASYLGKHFSDVLPCYLEKKDNHYHWQKESVTDETVELDGRKVKVKAYALQMQSLRWTVAEEDKVSDPVWQHRMMIYVPEKISADSALLYINGGTIHQPDGYEVKNKGPNDDLLFPHIAAQTESVVVDLKDIPNQFLQFGNQPPLKEDALVAYTWKKFIENPQKNYNWPLRLPMVKASIRAMDTAQAFMKSQKVKVDHFVLSGGSKRGWTVWLTAAMDNRVSAIAPMVIDVLNLQDSMRHHYNSYKRWAPAVKDYYSLMPTIGTKPLTQLMEVVDPYSYLPQLTMPKYIINATGDDFFLPDSSRFYFDDLRGDKWIRFLPDLRHYIVKMDRSLVSATVESFYGAIIEDRPMPTINWDVSDEKLKVISSLPPKAMKLWSAENPEARDFRTSPDNPAVTRFKPEPLSFHCKDSCRANISLTKPEKGWNASFVELIYPNPPYRDLSFTTRVFVTPDKYPE
ncbi:PhoPQ-activated pathogenicity-related family protein [Endozoicomonas arenosclerae]|uniref:PhoPQ-activated pathogenicity-related family protein n=1 Tax=Endozoicomonas arenosclerae TaxID=1633495 RepID=UPI00078218DE|nr:PhoPQ-activated protein PqaA family protein [Endozoicomonas arenosclerae]